VSIERERAGAEVRIRGVAVRVAEAHIKLRDAYKHYSTLPLTHYPAHCTKNIVYTVDTMLIITYLVVIGIF
jgi:hypothetical protein